MNFKKTETVIQTVIAMHMLKSCTTLCSVGNKHTQEASTQWVYTPLKVNTNLQLQMYVCKCTLR